MKVRDLVAEMVAEVGLIPVLAKDASEGLAHVRAGADLLVVGIQMREVDGPSFLRRIRAIDRKLPILVMASDAMALHAPEAQALGVVGCLVEPFAHFEFREAPDAALYEGRRTRSDLGGDRGLVVGRYDPSQHTPLAPAPGIWIGLVMAVE